MRTLKENISNWLLADTKAYTVAEVAEHFQLNSGADYKELVKTIAQMEKEGTLIFTKKGKVRRAKAAVVLDGTIRVNDRGFGFVSVDPDEDDIFVKKDDINYALDGDTVEIDIMHPANPFLEKGAEGKVVAINKRNLTRITGDFTAFDPETREDSGYLGYVISKDIKLSSYKIYITDSGLHPVDGNVVSVTIKDYPSKKAPDFFVGAVVEILGHKNDPGMDILALIVSLGIETKFSKEVLAAAEAVPETIDPADLTGRHDLRAQTYVTIDGADAKDLDDAVTVKKLDNGNFFLGVSIADVSHYVTEDSVLDQSAYARGTSVYLTDRVVPMLPQRLSNGICSLNPHLDRLTMTCEMEIDHTGHVVKYDIFPSVINTTARMTYDEVNEILAQDTPATTEKYADLVSFFFDMRELHDILSAMRERRGAINFEEREARVIVDELGHPTDIVFRKRGTAEKIIESFMLAANETVAGHFQKLDVPFVYRIHEAPKPEKMQRFFDFITVFGITVHGTKENISGNDLQNLLAKVADKPEAPVVSQMLLRSMQQAKYSTDPLGHYGLGADDYTHFTSPIRRYPDLMVHRLIHTYGKHPSEALQNKYAKTLPEITEHSSKMERLAVDAERAVDAMKKAEFLQDRVGEEFSGVISSVTKFGFFVELPNTIEGLVHVNTLQQDYFNFVERQMALVGEHTRITFKLGQKVIIRVTKSDPETRNIDFEIVEAEGVNAADLKKRRHYNATDHPVSKKKGKHHKHQNNGKKHNEKNASGKATEKETIQESVSSTKNKGKNKRKKPYYAGVSKRHQQRGKK